MGGRSREQQKQYRQQNIASLRDRPLEAVFSSMGFQRDKGDKKQYIAQGSRISINGDLWFDHAGKGGKGAIDLQMHLTNSDFKTAVADLSGVQLSVETIEKQVKSKTDKLYEDYLKKGGV